MSTIKVTKENEKVADKESTEEPRGGGGGVKAELHGRPRVARAVQARAEEDPGIPLHHFHSVYSRDPEKYWHEWQTVLERCTALEEKNTALEEKNTALEEKNTALEEKNTALEEKNTALEEKNMSLEEENKELKNKASELKKHLLHKVNIKDDGNCLFRAVGRLHPRYEEDDHEDLRQLAYEWCKDNRNTIHISDKQLENIGRPNTPVTFHAIEALANILKCKFDVRGSVTITPTGAVDCTIYLSCDLFRNHIDALVENTPDDKTTS